MGKYDPAKSPLAEAKDGRPAFIRNVDDLPAEDYERGEIAGTARDLGEATGTKLLGVDITIIPPGKKSSHMHRHVHKEEFFYVLSGRCKVRVGMAEYELRPGDAVARPADSKEHHQFHNPYSEPCQVMMLGIMAGKGVEDVIEWPELGRVLRIDAEGGRKIEKVARAG